MAKDLYELAWTFRDAEIPDVRMAVLHSIATVSGLLGEQETLALVLGESQQSGVVQLRRIVETDSDQECRMMALSLIKSLSETTARQPLLTVVASLSKG